MYERHTRLADLQTCVIADTGLATRLQLVFLHGYDMSPADLTPFAHSLALPGVSYAFPQAPAAVSETGYAWWPRVDEQTAGREGGARDLWQEYPAGRASARGLIRNLLGVLKAKCDAPLVLAGFSQGGMLACDTVLLEDTSVEALAMMSASCIAAAEWHERRHRLDGMPAFVSHGRADTDLSFDAGRRVADFLTSGGARVSWMPFDGGHGIPFLVWRQFKRFVQATLHEYHQDYAYS
jgi:phospholipase/carboxylesterase